MARRRPLSVIAALCAVVALQAAPAAAQVGVVPGSHMVITELPELSELPPLPVEDGEPAPDEAGEPAAPGISAVQTVALALAVGALVAGGTGLALVTRRARGEVSDEQPRLAPTSPRPAR